MKMVIGLALALSASFAHAQQLDPAPDVRSVLLDVRELTADGAFDRLDSSGKKDVMDRLQGVREILRNGHAVNSSLYACIASGNDYFRLTDVTAGKALGESVYGIEICNKLIPSHGQKVICVPKGGDYFSLYSLGLGGTLGASVYSLNACTKMIPAVSAQFACVSMGSDNFSVTNLNTGVVLGASVYGFEECSKTLPKP
jgi:hypothetical protein